MVGYVLEYRVCVLTLSCRKNNSADYGNFITKMMSGGNIETRNIHISLGVVEKLKRILHFI